MYLLLLLVASELVAHIFYYESGNCLVQCQSTCCGVATPLPSAWLSLHLIIVHWVSVCLFA